MNVLEGFRVIHVAVLAVLFTLFLTKKMALYSDHIAVKVFGFFRCVFNRT